MSQKGKNKKHSANFKAQVVIEALKEQKTLQELAQKYEVHSVMISRWKAEFLDKAGDVFGGNKSELDSLEKERDMLYKKVGELQIANDFYKKNLHKL